MSDPFSDIDNEVYLDKIKSFFKKFKFRIIGITSFLLIVAIGFSLYSNSKNNKKAKLSEYYVEILSIIETDPKRAKQELIKLEKLDKGAYKDLSNLLIFKLHLEENELDSALETLIKIENNVKSNGLKRIINFYYAQVYLEKGNTENFDVNINKLLSYGGMWAMLAYELRGHYYFQKKDYSTALKNFNKIINNQQASSSIRSRAIEMINNVNLYYENSS